MNETIRPPADDSTSIAYRRCSHPANASEAEPMTASVPFRSSDTCDSARMAADRLVRLPACGFLLVFRSNRGAKMHRARNMGHTERERRTDRQTESLLNAAHSRAWYNNDSPELCQNSRPRVTASPFLYGLTGCCLYTGWSNVTEFYGRCHGMISHQSRYDLQSPCCGATCSTVHVKCDIL